MLTVMFSSHNGAEVLPRFLDSLSAAEPPEGGFKLVGVNNASTDATGDILSAFSSRLPLVAIDEPVPGKNRGLNRALVEAEGDLFVFCDDDVVVAKDWLTAWRRTADERKDHQLFAGVTEPLWPAEPRAWNLRASDVSIVFGTNEHMREGPCDAMCMLGTNMAIRAEAMAGVKFNPNVGPDGSRFYPMGSETELARRLQGRGFRCWFAMAPRVKHIIRPHQMQASSILQRGYRWGRGQGHMGIAHHYSPDLLHRKNMLRRNLYPLLMRFYSQNEAWARQWEWAVDQGYEDGWREARSLPPRWGGQGAGPRIASRFTTRGAA